MLAESKKKPKHVAIIMDGNGRWAQNKGLDRVVGHAKGVEVSEEIIEAALDNQIEYLTLYAFSLENWQRPKEEVARLMELLKEFLITREPKMIRKKIQFHTIGQIEKMPSDVRQTIAQIKQKTQCSKPKLNLTLALSYGGRDEILRAINQARVLKKTEITEAQFEKLLDTHFMPDPDLIIRTSGEHRVSNFLLWQSAYAEYFFEPCLWPDFSTKHFVNALKTFAKRERRYGAVNTPSN